MHASVFLLERARPLAGDLSTPCSAPQSCSPSLTVSAALRRRPPLIIFVASLRFGNVVALYLFCLGWAPFLRRAGSRHNGFPAAAQIYLSEPHATACAHPYLGRRLERSNDRVVAQLPTSSALLPYLSLTFVVYYFFMCLTSQFLIVPRDAN